jgi:NAD-dependent deacetylase
MFTLQGAWNKDAPPQLLILSGAGLSAESGLRTFRDGGGLWEGHDIDVVCNFDTWRENLELVHGFYQARREAAAGAAPNPAHAAVARWQARWPTHILTQNVDDLLERAGCTDVCHLHGRLQDMRCYDCDHEWEHGLGPWVIGRDACPECGAMRAVKPGVVFFGEMAPAYHTLQVAMDSLRPQDVLLVIGTSGQVLPVARMGLMTPGPTILNNLEPSESIPDHCFDHTIYRPAGDAVGEVEALLREYLD